MKKIKLYNPQDLVFPPKIKLFELFKDLLSVNIFVIFEKIKYVKSHYTHNLNMSNI